MAQPMKTWSFLLLVGCCLAGGWVTAGCASRPASASVPIPADSIEIRRAETEPADGLEAIEDPRTGKKLFLDPATEAAKGNADIAAAQVKIPADESAEVSLHIQFTEAGQQKMERLTKGHQGKPLAVFIDGKLRWAPLTHEGIRSEAEITGAFTREEAQQLAKAAKGK